MTMHGAGFALYHPPPLDGEILDLSKKHHQSHHHQQQQQHHHHEVDVKPYLSPLPLPVAVAVPPPAATQGELLYMLGQPPLSSPPPPTPPQQQQQQPAAPSRPAKPTRPFKAYPKDPLSLSLPLTGNADVLLGHDPNQAYAEFRRRMLEQVQVASRPPAQKRPASPGPQQPSSSDSDKEKDKERDKDKDAAYWERRRKNNEAAKRSRDARRAKEDEIAIRAAFLEQENIKLRYEVAALRTETGKLRCLLYNR